MPIIKFALLMSFFVSLLGCGGGDQLYCSRYQYLYNQLLESDAPPELVIRQALQAERAKPDANQAELEFMEQVLNDFIKGLKSDDVSPRDYCLEEERYKDH